MENISEGALKKGFSCKIIIVIAERTHAEGIGKAVLKFKKISVKQGVIAYLGMGNVGLNVTLKKGPGLTDIVPFRKALSIHFVIFRNRMKLGKIKSSEFHIS